MAPFGVVKSQNFRFSGIKKVLYGITFLLFGPVSAPAQVPPDIIPAVVGNFRKLTSQTEWKLIKKIPLQFNARHTQGLVKAGAYYYLTAVEVTRRPQRFETPRGRYDRDTGEGRGHLFKFDENGRLADSVLLGENTIYHPGGMDSDGSSLWIPVCEYRPFGPSLIYKVDLETLKATKAARHHDAIGALAFDRTKRVLTGANWGSRCFYQWIVLPDGPLKDTLHETGVRNPSFYIDYQDCHGVGNGLMICSGLQQFRVSPDQPLFRLGGMDLIDLRDFRPVHQVPVKLWSPSGAVMTTNPFWIETTSSGLRVYFIPDDDHRAVLYIYEATLE